MDDFTTGFISGLGAFLLACILMIGALSNKPSDNEIQISCLEIFRDKDKCQAIFKERN